jgi:death-on-curing protein
LSRELVESACDRPHNHWAYDGVEDVVSLAAILLFGIAANHAFLQGNKRTAFAAMSFFLEDNGFRLALHDDPRCADDLIAALEGGISQESFARRLHFVVAPIDERDWT